MAVLAAWDTTALNNLTTATGTTEENSVGSLGSLDGKLVECVDGTTSLEDSGACCLCKGQCAHFNGWKIQDTEVVGDSSNYHGNLVCSFVKTLDEGLEGDRDFVGTAVVKALQYHFVETRGHTSIQEFVELD
jgi:hypothetical protein